MVANSKKNTQPEKFRSTGKKIYQRRELLNLTSKLVTRVKIFGLLDVVRGVSELLSPSSYAGWYAKFQKIKRQDKIKILAQIDKFQKRPVLGLILTETTNRELTIETIASIRRQLYPDWKLFIGQIIFDQLPEFCNDSRVCIIEKNDPSQLCDYLAPIRAGDIIASQALYLVAGAGQNPNIKVIYSDEDEIDNNGVLSNPVFKVSWDPELASYKDMCGSLCFVTAHLFNRHTIKAEDLFSEIKRNAFLTLEKRQFSHLPFPIYHKRKTGSKEASSSVYDTKKEERAEPTEKISVIIATRDKKLLIESCLRSIFEGSSFTNFEVIIVDNGSTESDSVQYLQSLETDSKVKLIRDDGAFNYSRLNNMAAKAATGSVLLFLNNDTELINQDSLRLMLQNLRDKIGVVGAKLLYSDNTVQHCGVVLGLGGIAGHIGRGLSENSLTLFNEPKIVSAVTGACLMIRRSLFEQLGGFDEVNLPIAFSDVDLCLRAQQQGYLVKYEPQAKFYHYESKSRVSDYSVQSRARYLKECRFMQEKWGHMLKRDPYFSPNYSLYSKHLKLASPPRVTQPWAGSSLF